MPDVMPITPCAPFVAVTGSSDAARHTSSSVNAAPLPPFAAVSQQPQDKDIYVGSPPSPESKGAGPVANTVTQAARMQPLPPPYPKSLCGKLNIYRKDCLGDPAYLRSLLWLLFAQFGDGIMLAGSAMVAGLVGLRTPLLTNRWLLTAASPAEKLVTQVGDMYWADQRDNAHSEALARCKEARGTLMAYRAEHTGWVRSTAWVDASCCAVWVGLALGGATTALAAWPAAAVIAGVHIACTWSRSVRHGAWDDLKFNLQQHGPTGQHRALCGVITRVEGILGMLATCAGAAVFTALEIVMGPAWMLTATVAALGVGCVIGVASKLRFAGHVCSLRDLSPGAMAVQPA